MFQEIETSRKLIIFPQKIAFLIFWETETSRKFVIIRKENLLVFQEVTLRARKVKRTHS